MSGITLTSICPICLKTWTNESSNENESSDENLSIEAATAVTCIKYDENHIKQFCHLCCNYIKSLYAFQEQATLSTDICQTLIASEENTLKELKLFCRLCLLLPQKGSIIKYRYGNCQRFNKICALIFQCTNLMLLPVRIENEDKIVNDERYPDIICRKCYNNLLGIKQIKSQAKQSKEIWAKMVEKHNERNDQIFEQHSGKIKTESNVAATNDSVSMIKMEPQIKTEPPDSDYHNSNTNEFSNSHIKLESSSEILENKTDQKVEHSQKSTKQNSILSNEDSISVIQLDSEIKTEPLDFEQDINNYCNTSDTNEFYASDVKYENETVSESVQIKTENDKETDSFLHSAEIYNHDEFLKEENNSFMDYNAEYDANINDNCPPEKNFVDITIVKEEQVEIEESIPNLENNQNEILYPKMKEESIEQNQTPKIVNYADEYTEYVHDNSSSFPNENMDVMHHSKNQEKLLNCPYCLKTFSHNYNIEEHIKTIHLKTTPKCEFCQQWFSSLSSLSEHIKTSHSRKEDKVFKCQYCEQSFLSTIELKYHHADFHFIKKGFSFKCNLCPKIFYRKVVLTQHLINVHSFKPKALLKCKLCKEIFVKKCELKIHMHRKHLTNEIETFECQFCEKIYFTKHFLTKHIKNIHSSIDSYKSNNTIDSTKGINLKTKKKGFVSMSTQMSKKS